MIKENYLVLLFFWISTCLPLQARADQPYLFVSVDCNKAKSELSINFESAWNEEGEKLVSEHKENRWHTWDLAKIETDKKGKYVIKRQVVAVSCSLENDQYVVTIAPETAAGYNPEGYCAAAMGAQVQVALGKRKIAQAANDGCASDGTVMKSITLTPKKEPKYTEMDAFTFYYSK